MQEFHMETLYCKGQYNVVADVLSGNQSDFLDSKKGMCKHDNTYSKVWRHEEMKDPSHSTD